MVGVPGRSKACNTCKKRRIRCGLERPQCANCVKSNRLCAGYQRERVFIVNQAVHPLSHTAQKVKPDSPETVDDQDMGITNPKLPIWKQKHRHPKPSTSRQISLIPAYRQQLLDNYIRTTIPDVSHAGPGATWWVQSLAQLPSHTPVLATAILAVSLSKAASVHHDANLRLQSLEHYTTGLWELQKALWSPDEMYRDETLAACLLLAVYELIECPGGSRVGFISHQDGAARLVQLRGPEAHVDGFGHAMFLAYRNMGILHGLDRRTPLFLAEGDWMTVPFQKHPKGMGERIWDAIAQAPRVFQRTDEMQRSVPVRSLCIALEALEYCWEVDGDLEKLYKELEASIPGPLFWPELAEKGTAVGGEEECDEAREGTLFPVAYKFFNLRMAMVLLSYWSLLTIVYNGMMLLHRVLETLPVDRKAVKALGDKVPAALLRGISADCPPGCACGGDPDVPCIVRFDMSTIRPLEHRGNVLGPVRDICQTVEYCTQPQMRDMGWTSIVAPLTIAVETIKEYDWCRREREWGRHVLRGFHRQLPYLKNMWY
ncbi:uncharacterized protein HMPREF1541_04753 [Cyphellophora europaea CBS 101466]|uniref:Zn(2)-C6 fungal-type domain-containing protein n=1 Tax=Cyphellophora europaea (strain CBS 101466) TaxID=1220924 RepID=W2RVE6_CYPE1|nr:uncharacterized protein HMPREF1541_04753 [Cyphellophora europaea CBS 101466]ETN40476.1 hypothetical protein HMPREF1541_04753 [Cyphellophora europaea CBS 101466]